MLTLSDSVTWGLRQGPSWCESQSAAKAHCRTSFWAGHGPSSKAWNTGKPGREYRLDLSVHNGKCGCHGKPKRVMEEPRDKDPGPGGGRDEAPKSSASRVVRFSTLSLLYLVQVKHRFNLIKNSSQGAPYGFQTACLPLLLRQAGLSFSSLSVMKLLFLPWVCKPLYSPVLERTLTRRTWLLVALITMAATCFLASFSVHQSDVTSLSLVLLLLNLASAAQVQLFF